MDARYGKRPRLEKDDLYLVAAQGYAAQKSGGFIARKGVAPWPLDFPLDWGADPYSDPNWCSKLQHWRMMDPIIREFFSTGNSELLEEAFAFAVDWHRFHYVEGCSAPRSWSDAVTGIRTIRLAFFLDRFQCGDMKLGIAHEKVLSELFDVHLNRLHDEDFISSSNHGLFQVLALRLSSIVDEDRMRANASAALADRKFLEIFRNQFDRFGVHREHSPAYHFFALNVIEPIARHFASHEVEATLAEADRVKDWFLFPDGSEVRVGDSNGIRRVGNVPEAPTAALADGRQYLVGEFTKSGYGIVRSIGRNGRSMLFVAAMANGTTHKHADDLGFELYEHGRRVLIDSGKYGYFPDKARRYVKSAAAHNTISLLNKPILPSKRSIVASSLGGLETEAQHFRIWGHARRETLFEHGRTFLYNPGRYLILLDTVRSEAGLSPRGTAKPLKFVSSLHFAPELEVTRQGSSIEARLPDGNRLIVDELSDATLKLVRGQTEPMLGWHSPDYGTIEPTTTLLAVAKAATRHFAWVIAIDPQWRDAALEIGRTNFSKMTG